MADDDRRSKSATLRLILENLIVKADACPTNVDLVITVGGLAAGEIESGRGRGRTVIACQPADERSCLLDGTEPPSRNLRQHEFDVLRGHQIEQRGLDRDRSDAVDADAIRRGLLAERFRESNHSRL